MRPHDLVLLHGQPGLGTDWQQVISLLPAHVRAVAPDRPGYGSSPMAGGGFEVNASAVIDDLDARGIGRAVLVGHSYGGGVALTVAARAPERVEALVLLAAVGPECLNGWDALLAAPVAGPVCAFCAWKLTPWFARARVRRLAHRSRARQQ
ncbi:MAG TPA: alpha/beta fold hydrolase, partial [Streptosporangiaceae bacterium]